MTTSVSSPRQLGYQLRARRSQAGVSLVEVLIVVAIMAGLSGLVIFGTGSLGGSRMRASATLVMSAVRVAMTHANTVGRPVRLVFDLDEQYILLEETRGRMLRVQDDQEGAKAGAEAATEMERAAQEYAKGIVDGPRAPAARFAPVSSFKDPSRGTVGRPLQSGTYFLQVQTEHDLEPVTEGRAYLYFWPATGTEQAVIQVGRRGDLTGLTVLVSALTGRVRLERGRLELEEGRADEYFDEREEL